MPVYCGKNDPPTYHSHESVKDRYQQIYFEALNLVINCIHSQFHQADFNVYLQEILLNPVKGECFLEELKIISGFYDEIINNYNYNKAKTQVFENLPQKLHMD